MACCSAWTRNILTGLEITIHIYIYIQYIYTHIYIYIYMGVTVERKIMHTSFERLHSDAEHGVFLDLKETLN